MKILVLNAGSSSIKYQLFAMPEQRVLATGSVERIGEQESTVHHKLSVSGRKAENFKTDKAIAGHEEALSEIVRLLMDPICGAIQKANEIEAIGHRVVHGGEKFKKPTLVDVDVLKALEEVSYLAPLHNPANLQGIAVAQKIFSNAQQVAVFDTAFHQSIPDYAYRYAIPEMYYEKHGLRAYGFHGTSHQYVYRESASFFEIAPEKFNAITIHLGNGCSMAAIKEGKCIDTSMGLTPVGGLIMGTRSGDIDPSLLLFLGQHLDMSFKEIDNLLNKESGLKGLAGDNDLRNILGKYEEKDPAARLSVAMYVYRIKKYIGSYLAILGRVDAIIFTAGVGENSHFIRGKVCEGLEVLGMVLDKNKNEQIKTGIREIQDTESAVKLLIVPTNEELEIANQACELLL